MQAVVTAQGRCEAPVVVVASGPWSRLVMAKVGIDLPLSTVRHQVATLTRPVDQIPDHPTVGDIAQSFSFRPDGSSMTFVGFGLTAAWWAGDGYPLALFILIIQGSIAMTQVSLFSLFMKISWTGAAATQFTVFMTLLNLGTAASPFLTRLHLSDAGSYVLCGAVAFLPVFLLPLLRPDTVEQRKQAELTPELVDTATT